MRGKLLAIPVILLAAIVCQCESTQKPEGYVPITTGGQMEILLADEMTYDQAWAIVNDVLDSNRYFYEQAEKERGYIETDWNYEATGEERLDYRCRAIVQFAPDRRSIKSKAQCEILEQGGLGEKWVPGTDVEVGRDLHYKLKSALEEGS